MGKVRQFECRQCGFKGESKHGGNALFENKGTLIQKIEPNNIYHDIKILKPFKKNWVYLTHFFVPIEVNQVLNIGTPTITLVDGGVITDG